MPKGLAMKRSLEELASVILAIDAKSNGRLLRDEGILDARRLRKVANKELPMSEVLQRRKTED